MSGSTKVASTITSFVSRIGIPAAIALILLMLHVVANTILRASLGSPIRGTNEISAYWYMPLIVFAGFALAQQKHEHIEARLVFDRLPRPVQLEFQALSGVLLTLLSVVFAWYSWRHAAQSFDRKLTGGVTGITIWPATFLAPVGFALLALQSGLDTVKGIRTRTLPDEWHEPVA